MIAIQCAEYVTVEFIKDFYIENDIPSALESNYFQEVPLQIVKTPEVNFTLNNTTYTYFDDYISYSSAPSISLNETEFIYVGYGIDDEKYSNYNTSGELISESWNAIIMILAPHARDPMNDIPIATFKVGRYFNIV